MVIGSAGPRTTKEVGTVAKDNLRHYEDAAGHVFSLNDTDAKLLGYKPVGGKRGARADAARPDDELSEREKALADREAELDKREKALATKASEKK